MQGVEKNCFGDVELCVTNSSSFSPLLYLIDGVTSTLLQFFFLLATRHPKQRPHEHVEVTLFRKILRNIFFNIFFPQERVECQDRMERRAIRDRVALERQQVVRDLVIKGDLSTWLDQRLNELQHCQVFYTSQKENVKAMH